MLRCLKSKISKLNIYNNLIVIDKFLKSKTSKLNYDNLILWKFFMLNF